MIIDLPEITLDSRSLINDELKQKHGHLFYISDIESLKSFINGIDGKALLTNRQIELLKAISFAYHEKTRFCSVSQIESFIEQSRDGINKAINSLVKLDIIKNCSIELIDGILPPRTKSFKLAEKKEFLNILSLLEDNKSKTKSNKRKSGISKAKSTTLEQYNLPQLVTENNVQRGMFPSQLPPFEKMLPHKGFQGDSFATEVRIKDQRVLVETKSSDSIMTDDDLKNLYTLMTLSLNQQANLVDYYLKKQCEPINHHYIEIRHLLKVLNKGSSGSYYDSFVKSIFRIKGTVFNLHALKSMFTDSLGESFFASPEFRFFESCTPISKEGPIVIKDENNIDRVEIKPFGFIIEWNKHLFKKMLTDKYFFVIPLKILSAPTLIFLFYMFLRNQFSFDRTRTLSFDLEQLHEKLNSSSLLHNFQRDFFNSLNNWNKDIEKLPKDGDINIDLQGFFLDVHISKGTITQVRCRVDAQKMLSHVGLHSEEGGISSKGKLAAPIVNNPLAPLLSFRSSRGEEFPSEFSPRLLLNDKNLLKNIDIRKDCRNHFTVLHNKTSTRITFYTDDNSILTLCEYTHQENEKQAAFFAHLQTLRNKLLPLCWRNGTTNSDISVETFSGLQDSLLMNHGAIIENDELYDLLSGQTQLVKIIASNWESSLKETLTGKVFELYLQKKTLNQQELSF